MLRALLILLMLAAPARADPPPPIACSKGETGPRHCIRSASFARDVCTQIAAEAVLNELPPGFFARLLWQESRFDPNAVSPARAMGIAQFIASTARLRGLDDPFNPADAIQKSAAYLAEMTRRYGNVGLAAIGYNGGERRAEGWIAGTGGLARETIDYVRIITGETAETWRDTPPDEKTFALDGETPFQPACEAMAAKRRVTPLAVPPPPAPRYAAFGSQIAYGMSNDAARAAYERLPGACRRAGPAARLELVPQERRGSLRPIIAARIGSTTIEQATQTCRDISNAGCICRVYRN